MTNGCLITTEDAERLRDLGVFDIQVSLEGPPHLHDDIRGRGSFAAASRGVKRLVRAGNTVSLNVTLSRLNAALIDETVGLARDLGVRAIGFSRLVPCGAGESLLDQFLSAGEVREAYERVRALDGPDLEVVSGDPLYGTLSGDVPAAGCGLTLSGCSAGFSGVTITSEGAVMACRRIGIQAGCLREKSLREIWADSALLWRLRRRESYRGKCGCLRALAFLPRLPRRGLCLHPGKGPSRSVCRRPAVLASLVVIESLVLQQSSPTKDTPDAREIGMSHGKMDHRPRSYRCPFHDPPHDDHESSRSVQPFLR